MRVKYLLRRNIKRCKNYNLFRRKFMRITENISNATTVKWSWSRVNKICVYRTYLSPEVLPERTLFICYHYHPYMGKTKSNKVRRAHKCWNHVLVEQTMMARQWKYKENYIEMAKLWIGIEAKAKARWERSKQWQRIWMSHAHTQYS